MNVGVVVLEAIALGVHRRARLLRARSAIEENERLVVDLLSENRKIRSDLLDVEGLHGDTSRSLFARPYRRLRHIA